MDRVNELFADPLLVHTRSEMSPIHNGIYLEDDVLSVRQSIKEQVEEVKWMNEVKRKQECVSEDDVSVTNTEIDQVLGVLDTSLVIDTKPQVSDIDLDTIRWAMHNPRMSDKIGDTFLPLSLPPERGWHSLESVGKYIILFGGLRFKDRQAVPQPFSAIIRPDEVEYLADLYIYDTENLSWHKISPRTSADRRSWPCGRYGHCAAAIDKYRMLLFGGRGDGGRYLSDTWVFSLVTHSWSPVTPGQNVMSVRPPPRAFAAMAPSRSTRTIVLYGGTNGTEVFSDIWVFKWGGKSFDFDRKEDDDGTDLGSHPSTCTVCDVHGAEDSMSAGSLGPHSIELLWARDVAVSSGSPPPGRYGHRLLPIAVAPAFAKGYGSSSTNTAKLRNGTYLAVVGGCCISPARELEGRENNVGSGVMPPNDIKKLLAMSHELQDRYAAEGGAAVIAGREIMQRLEDIEMSCGLRAGSGLATTSSFFDIKEVNRRAAAITARMAELEQSTRALESDMAETWYSAQATSMMIRATSSHPSPNMGIHFLCVDDMAWAPQLHPKISGTIPCSRMHLSAVALGDFICVVGGVKPTALSFRLVDDECSLIYALDLKTMVWWQPSPMNSKNYLDGPLRVAQADITRAQERLNIEKARGIAEGARAGVTVEVVEAESVLKVCQWRKQMLLKEQRELLNPPQSFWGGGMCMMAAAGNAQWEGNRALLHGGWGVHGAYGDVCAHAGTERPPDIRDAADKTTDCMIVLDLEQELERRRRLEEEFHAKLERDRLEEESKAFQNKIQSLFELREAARQARERQQNEIKKMMFEDFLSSLPPLSKPNPVQFVKSNQHTIWVRWDQSKTTSVGKLLRPGSVTYYLYMAGGFVTYTLGDRVQVTPPIRKQDEQMSSDVPEDIFNRAKGVDCNSDVGSEEGEEEDASMVSIDPKQAVKYIPQKIDRVPFKGEIIGIKRGQGIYTVRADDGSIEKWHRSCLSLLLLEEQKSVSHYKTIERAPKKLTKRQVSFQKAQVVAKSLSAANDVVMVEHGGHRMGKEWKLIYRGDQTEYAVEGLVPWDALQTEPGITVRVKFCIRTVGVDYPDTEYSDKSDPVEFSTTWVNLEEPDEDVESAPVSVMASSSSKMSRAKKEIFTAVLNDHKTVQLEKWHDFVSGEGVFDTFV